VAAATMVGFNYGTNLSLFPSVTKDYFGLKNFGINYGLLFSAWGIGGFIFPRLSQMIVAQTGTQHTAYLLCSILLAAGAILSLMTRAPGQSRQKQGVLDQFREQIGFARAQPVDVYLGSRHI
jgi:MFS family permease